MSIPELCAWIQDSWLSRLIATTTWGYPIVGAMHVLTVAIFGGTVIYTHFNALGILFRGRSPARTARDVRQLKLTGGILVLTTGALLFASGAVRYYGSVGFRIKMALLVLMVVNAVWASGSRRPGLHAGLSLTLWAGLIFAARAIAYF